jgi:hypothetical protein
VREGCGQLPVARVTLAGQQKDLIPPLSPTFSASDFDYMGDLSIPTVLGCLESFGFLWRPLNVIAAIKDLRDFLLDFAVRIEGESLHGAKAAASLANVC